MLNENKALKLWNATLASAGDAMKSARKTQVAQVDKISKTHRGRKDIGLGSTLAGGYATHAYGSREQERVDKRVSKYGKAAGIKKYQSENPIKARLFLPKNAKVAKKLANRGTFAHAMHAGSRLASGHALGLKLGRTRRLATWTLGHGQGAHIVRSGVGGANASRYWTKVSMAKKGYHRDEGSKNTRNKRSSSMYEVNENAFTDKLSGWGRSVRSRMSAGKSSALARRDRLVNSAGVKKVGGLAHQYGGGADYARASQARARMSTSPGGALARLDIADKFSGKEADKALAGMSRNSKKFGKLAKGYQLRGHLKRYGIPAAAVAAVGAGTYGVHRYRKSRRNREEMFLDPIDREQLQEAIFASIDF